MTDIATVIVDGNDVSKTALRAWLNSPEMLGDGSSATLIIGPSNAFTITAAAAGSLISVDEFAIGKANGSPPHFIDFSVVSDWVKLGRKLVLKSGTPASATATGVQWTVLVDASYIYVCTATNVWKRAALSTW